MKGAKFISFLLWIVLLPLSGAYLADPQAIRSRFLPSAIIVTSKSQVPEHPVSWILTALLALFGISLAAAFLFFLKKGLDKEGQEPVSRIKRAFPNWGWIALCLLFVFWGIAWYRFDHLNVLNHLAFSMIWFSYIVFMNALTFRRTGNCLLINHFPHLLMLYAASIPFWWYFEYLNRFVFNWYYLFNESSGAFQYYLFGTVAFGTVLPAVISTSEFLQSFRALPSGFDGIAKFRLSESRFFFPILFALSSLILFLLPLYPEQLFLFLWIAPLFILVSLQGILGEKQIFSPATHGSYTMIVAAALAAAITGSLWELWNYYSVPKWIYSVPYVGHLKLFEMPLIGYLGYLPFGMECLAIYCLIKQDQS